MNNLIIKKKKYVFLLTLTLLGILCGIIFITFISKDDKYVLVKELDLFFKNTDKINYIETFKTCLLNNFISIIILYILAISIIGIPFILLFLFVKGFIVGFSISSIINTYKFKGILYQFAYLFPHKFLLLIIYILLGFYSINFSIRLFKSLFLKEDIILSKYFLNLNKVFVLSIIICFICSLLETFLCPLLIKII